MSAPPDRVELARQWVEKAEHDLLNAEHTLTLKSSCPLDTVCFHAQQCAEKYLKGSLVFHAVDFPKTHDLILLNNLLNQIMPSNVDLAWLKILNRYSVEARYPGEWEPISRKEAKMAVKIAKEVKEIVMKGMK